MLFGSTALEVAIGMVFVYFLMSLLCSAIAEYIEAKLNNRAKDLEKGIRLLLDQSDAQRGEAQAGAGSLAAELYKHPLVRSLYRGEKLPSYIPSRTFALALWDMAFPPEQRAGAAASDAATKLKTVRDALNNNTFVSPEVKRAMLVLLDDAGNDFEKARRNIEEWYDSSMDRVSGWYKRRVHVFLLLLGIGIAAFVNADTINIARALIQDDVLRATLVKTAEKDAQTPLPQPSPTPEDPREQAKDAAQKAQAVRAQLNTLGIPLGWTRTVTEVRNNQEVVVNADDPRRVPNTPGGWGLKILGLLITGLAVSQGAPFWFDLLNKIIVIRSTVKPREKSPETPPKEKPAPQTEEETSGKS